MDAAVEVMGLTKSYRRWEHTTLKQYLVFGRPKTQRHTVIHDLTLRIDVGEFVALIGPNGSGKSTLFRILCGAYRPDSGIVRVKGRVGAMLDLTAAFHADLTGLENIELNAAFLGLGRQETRQRIPFIIEYSELAEHINKPVRFYSAGMVSRLAFAVNTCVSADVLLIDEVLAVGDESFQQRCLAKLRKLHQAGTTIVFVSHHLDQVLTMTQRCIWLEWGRVIADGPTADVVARYKDRYGAVQ
jgi:ABC-2 type transport system ATP-binding protein